MKFYTSDPIHPSRFYLLNDETKLITRTGFQTIYELKVGDEILDSTGNYNQITQIHLKKQRKEYISIQMKYLGCKPNQLFLTRTKKNTEPCWTAASDLSQTAYLALWVNNNSITPTVGDVLLDNPDFWFLFGFFAQNGHLGSSKRDEINFFINSDNIQFLERIRKHLNLQESTPLYYRCYDAFWYKLLKHFYLGENSQLPSFLLDAPVDLLHQFVNGLFTPKPCVYAVNRRKGAIRYVLKTPNIGNAYVIQSICFKLHCAFSINPGVCDHHNPHLRDNRVSGALQKSEKDPYFWCKIHKISSQYENQSYGFTLKNKTPAIILENLLYHNMT